MVQYGHFGSKSRRLSNRTVPHDQNDFDEQMLDSNAKFCMRLGRSDRGRRKGQDL